MSLVDVDISQRGLTSPHPPTPPPPPRRSLSLLGTTCLPLFAGLQISSLSKDKPQAGLEGVCFLPLVTTLFLNKTFFNYFCNVLFLLPFFDSEKTPHPVRSNLIFILCFPSPPPPFYAVSSKLRMKKLISVVSVNYANLHVLHNSVSTAPPKGKVMQISEVSFPPHSPGIPACTPPPWAL